jgi:hypothetical protein
LPRACLPVREGSPRARFWMRPAAGSCDESDRRWRAALKLVATNGCSLGSQACMHPVNTHDADR